MGRLAKAKNLTMIYEVRLKGFCSTLSLPENSTKKTRGTQLWSFEKFNDLKNFLIDAGLVTETKDYKAVKTYQYKRKDGSRDFYGYGDEVVVSFQGKENTLELKKSSVLEMGR